MTTDKIREKAMKQRMNIHSALTQMESLTESLSATSEEIWYEHVRDIRDATEKLWRLVNIRIDDM